MESVDQHLNLATVATSATRSAGTIDDVFPPDNSAPDTRFGLSHLLVWTCCCGLYMGVVRFVWSETIVQRISALMLVNTVLGSFSSGAYLAGVILFAVRRIRGMRFPVHAGEWLLVVNGMQLAISLAVASLARMTMETPYVVWRSVPLMTCWAFLWPVRRAGLKRRWKVFYVSSLLAQLSWGLGFTGAGLMGAVTVPAAVQFVLISMLVGVLWLDRQESLSPPWTHWAGVVAFLWGHSLITVFLGILFLEHYFGWNLAH